MLSHTHTQSYSKQVASLQQLLAKVIPNQEQLATVNGGGDDGSRLRLATVKETFLKDLHVHAPHGVKGFKSSKSGTNT